ncbi:hypothetical protein, partial [Methylorubrum aminovorans]|uniref:hypothetical protein n=1 Tax=Methylorubrum aminovorans TaxID=269069 RepID=UPI001EDFF38E
SGTDGIDGFEIGIALPSGHHAIQRPNHRSAPKVRKNRNFDPLRRGIGVQFWFIRTFGAFGLSFAEALPVSVHATCRTRWRSRSNLAR